MQRQSQVNGREWNCYIWSPN